MANGFALHGIDHLSPSSINTFTAAPALWAVERLLGYRSPSNASMSRGTAAEAGVSAALFNPTAPMQDCIDLALKEYDRLMALVSDNKRQEERDAIPGIVTEAATELRLYGIPTKPEGRQHFVSVTLDDVPVPIIGYKDWHWDQHGITVDLKSQLKLSSEISVPHARQVSIYVYGTNNQARVCYATPKKRAVYTLENAASHIEALRQTAIRMNRFLSLSKDKEELIGLLVPDYQSFYYSSPVTRAKCQQVFGF